MSLHLQKTNKMITFKQLLAERHNQLNNVRANAQCHISAMNGDTPEQYAETLHQSIVGTITLELMN